MAALLVEQGFFETEDEARRWVMAGQVLVNGQHFTKAGMAVPADAALQVRGRHRFASRGGLKLEAALDHFGVTVEGRVTLDSGASTGGFTDCLLQRGAALVYAVEVGYGQLLGRLRVHPRVRNLERTNLGDPVLRTLDPRPSLLTLDLSYLSLTTALPLAATILAPQGGALALLKPLFEVESAQARRSGQVTDSRLLVSAVRQVLQAGTAAGFAPVSVVKLALRPRHGVPEFFVYLTRGTGRWLWEGTDAELAALVEEPGIGPMTEM